MPVPQKIYSHDALGAYSNMPLESMCSMPEAVPQAPPETNMFTDTYLNYANQTVTYLVSEGKSHTVSRAKVEMDILECVDGPEFPTSFRIVFFSLVLHTDTFDIFWLAQQDLHNLSDASITRLQPDLSLLNELVPLPAEDTDSDTSRDSSPEIPLLQARGLAFPEGEQYTFPKSESPDPGLPTPSATISREEAPLHTYPDDDSDENNNDDDVPLRYRTRSKTPKPRFASPDSDHSYEAVTPGLEMSDESPEPDDFADFPTDPTANEVEPHYGSKGGKTIAPPAAKKAPAKRGRGKSTRGGSTRGGTAKGRVTKETTTKTGATRGGSTRGKRGGVKKPVATKTLRKTASTRGRGKGKSIE